MGRTHALSGLAAALATAAAADPWLTLDAPRLAAVAVLGTGAGVLPDLDHPQATPARVFGPPTGAVARVVNLAAGGHRNATHSLLGLAALTAGAQMATGHPAAAAAVAALLLGLALAALEITDGGPLARLPIAGGAGYAALTWAPDILAGPVLPLAVAAGSAAHVTGDLLTDHGCPLAWPLQHRLALPLVTTGGRLETWIIRPALLLATAAAAGTALTMT